ncbi:MAG: F0F1 ATP synthase subunit epsilon [Limimaricola sp.]|uniref:F0F1 ATP synthase subunit epsilon n=1 Tax=Limimaricola sp. TaxID=2211665 RepID=UPI001DAD7009|nr:F0F1 ATP synthase subunit epsilon [Limimaricola sp.]MBI1417793.1 F0F1 ATP synthase subunit epsilon [Limimaricola sp.]
MADMMQFDLVSPERRLASVQASEVQIPGADGDLTAMPGHAPVITTLRPGVLKVVHGSGNDEYIVSGGFAEITAEGVTVLAEQSMHRTEVTQEIYDKMLAEVRAYHAEVREKGLDANGLIDDAAKLISDMVAMGDHIGLSND